MPNNPLRGKDPITDPYIANEQLSPQREELLGTRHPHRFEPASSLKVGDIVGADIYNNGVLVTADVSQLDFNTEFNLSQTVGLPVTRDLVALANVQPNVHTWSLDQIFSSHVIIGTDPGGTEPLRVGGIARVGGFLRLYSGANDGVTTDSDLRGSSANLILSAKTGGSLFLNFDHGNQIRISGTGLVFETDNAIDIGATATTNRPRTIYVGTSGVFGTDPGGSAALRIGGNVTISNLLKGVNDLGLDTTSGSGNIIFFLNAVEQMRMTSAAFKPAVAGGLTLGTSTLPWGNAYLTNIGIGAAGDVLDYSTSGAGGNTWLKARGTGIISFQVPNGTAVLDITSTVLAPHTSAGLTLGTSGLPWGATWVGKGAELHVMPQNNVDEGGEIDFEAPGGSYTRVWINDSQTDRLRWHSSGTEYLILTSVSFASPAKITLGTASQLWGNAYLGNIYAQGPSGTITSVDVWSPDGTTAHVALNVGNGNSPGFGTISNSPLYFFANNANKIKLDQTANAFSPFSANLLTLGTSSLSWGASWFNGQMNISGAGLGAYPALIIGDTVTGAAWYRASLAFTDSGTGGHTYAVGPRDGTKFSISDETSGVIVFAIDNTNHSTTLSYDLTVSGATTVVGDVVGSRFFSNHATVPQFEFKGGVTRWGGMNMVAADILRFYDSGATVKLQLNLSGTAGKLIPPSTSFSLRNNADSADNLLLTDAGVGTFRNDLIVQFGSGTSRFRIISPDGSSSIFTIQGGNGGTPGFGTISNSTFTFIANNANKAQLDPTANAFSPFSAGLLSLGTASLPWGQAYFNLGIEIGVKNDTYYYLHWPTGAQITGGWGTDHSMYLDGDGHAFRKVGGSNVWNIDGSGNFVGDATNAGYFKLGPAVSKIIPGVTSLSLRNNGDSANNILITDAGVVTIRSNTSPSVAGAATLGTSALQWGKTWIGTGTIGSGVSAEATVQHLAVRSPVHGNWFSNNANGAQIYAYDDVSAGVNAVHLSGAEIVAQITVVSGTYHEVRGAHIYGDLNGSGTTVDEIWGVDAQVGTQAGTITDAAAVKIGIYNSTGVQARITNAAGINIFADPGTPNLTSIATNQYGVKVGDITGGTLNYTWYSGLGQMRLGDQLQLVPPAATDALKITAVAGGKVIAITQVASTTVDAITLSGGTLTGSTAKGILNFAQTWNTSGVPTAILLNITNTASGANSKLLDLQVSAQTTLDHVLASATLMNTRFFSPDGTVQFNLNVGNGGTPGFGTISNHTISVFVNNLTKWTFDTSGNLTASLTQGGMLSFRPGTQSTYTAASIGRIYSNHGLTRANTVDGNLATFTLKGNTLVTDGDVIRIYISGQCTGNTGSWGIKFGATDNGPNAVGNGHAFTGIFTIVRTGATAQIFHEGGWTGGTLFTNRVTPAETLSGDITIAFHGSALAAGTLYFDTIKVIYEPA